MSEARLEIRRTEPHDSAALREIHAQSGVIWGTLQLPFPSAEQWRRVSDAPERIIGFVTEGRLAKLAFRDGGYCDALFMARVH